MADAASLPNVTKNDILAGLRALGINPGLGLMVHSSLSRFGHVEGGAQAVVDALMEALTPEGTLMLPSFNHGGAFGEGKPGYYDSRETPTSNGAIPNLFWRLPGVYRSLNPTHAFAAWGKNAREFTHFHHRTITMGPDSPLGLLWRDGGYCLLMGATYNSNTFHHVVEMTTGAPCLGRRTEAYPVRLPDGRTVMGRTWGWRERGCPYTKSGRYHERMRERGMERTTKVGNSALILFKLQDCYDAAAQILREGADGLPPCSGCPIRPLRNARTVPSDWDDKHNCLMPESEAWTY
jgi:aminoglycoside 3-N-acetyltransferase